VDSLKRQVLGMRIKRMSYGQISAATGVPLSTVGSWCREARLVVTPDADDYRSAGAETTAALHRNPLPARVCRCDDPVDVRDDDGEVRCFSCGRLRHHQVWAA
jgi:hypothetical protein